jgi:hypothetical protein
LFINNSYITNATGLNGGGFFISNCPNVYFHFFIFYFYFFFFAVVGDCEQQYI